MNEAINKLCQMMDTHYITVSAGGAAQALLDTENDVCWLNGGASQSEILALLSAGQPEVAEENEAVAKKWNKRQRMPLTQFLWWAGLHYSQGEVIECLQTFPKYRLVNWPDFSWMMHTKSHLDITRSLIRQPADLQTLSADVGVSQASVIAFINACYLCGWVKGKMTADYASEMWQASESPDDLPDVISKIRTSLDM